MKRMPTKPQRIEYTGIDELMYSIKEAGKKLGITRGVLSKLAKEHPVFAPRPRHNGLKRPVYTNHQLAAIKQVLLGNIPPDEAVKMFMNADRNEADSLAANL